MKQTVKAKIGLHEAMENLSAIVSMEENGILGIAKKGRFVTSEEEFGSDTDRWISAEGKEPILDLLSLTFGAIHHHLLGIYSSEEMNWGNPRTVKGIETLIDLIGQAAEKIERFLVFHLGKEVEGEVRRGKQFQELLSFYENHFSPRLKGEEELIEEDLGGREVFQDLEALKNDSEYELFYIRKEDGSAYFDKEVLKNVRLGCDFQLDPSSFEEDPLLKVRSMQDRDYYAAAGQILKEQEEGIDAFFRKAHLFEESAIAAFLNKGLIALFLAANPRYLVQNTVGKSCLQYFLDFQHFLREAFQSQEYQKWIAYPPDSSDKLTLFLMKLIHSLARGLFVRKGGVQTESVGLIHRAMRKGEEEKKKKKEHLLRGDTPWNQLLLDDEKLRFFLAQFPSGPLFKVLDLIREEEVDETVIPFDPIMQQNLPAKVYEIEKEGKRAKVLRLPSPTVQTFIHKAEIIPEFKGFLREIGAQGEKLFICNFQDRSSWKEHARASALEGLQMNAEFSDYLTVVTIPKETDFYYQNNEFLDLSDAKKFLDTFQELLKNPQEIGFFFPAKLQKAEMERFFVDSLPKIHERFFQSKKKLSRRNREDFIEIFYQMLIGKCIQMLKPDYICFTCKDGIDSASISLASFFAFNSLFSGGIEDKKDQEFIRFLLYTPALFIRERGVNPEQLYRFISMLERVDETPLQKEDSPGIQIYF